MRFIKKNKILVAIFLVALFVRLLRLGSFPLGFHADEIRVGWNAYSILKTGKDDLGNTLALYYNTFGDYRPTGIFYLTIPSLLIFGLTSFAVRFPSAIIGALTVFPLYWLTSLIGSKISKSNKVPALFASLVLALSPWHIFLSRATSEGIMSLFIALCGLCTLLLSIKKEKTKYFVTTFMLFVVSAQFYHMVRPMILVLSVVVTAFYWRTMPLITRKKSLFLIATIGLFVGLLLTSKSSLGRLSQVSVVKYQDNVLGEHTSAFSVPMEIKNEYSKYFSLDFLTGDSPKPYRYRVFGVGLISISTLVGLVCAFIAIARKELSPLPFFLLLLSPLPAAVTGEDSPNLHRALFMLPFIAILSGFGLYWLWKQGFLQRLTVLGLTTWIIISTIIAMGIYFTTGAMDAAPYRNYGARRVAQALLNREKNFSNVIVSDDPDPLYPWYAFLGKKDPANFNTAAIARLKGDWTYEGITFTKNKCPSATFLEDKKYLGDILVIDAPTCDIYGTQKEHPDAVVTLVPTNAAKESQYHFWERKQ